MLFSEHAGFVEDAVTSSKAMSIRPAAVTCSLERHTEKRSPLTVDRFSIVKFAVVGATGLSLFSQQFLHGRMKRLILGVRPKRDANVRLDTWETRPNKDPFRH